MAESSLFIGRTHSKIALLEQSKLPLASFLDPWMAVLSKRTLVMLPSVFGYNMGGNLSKHAGTLLLGSYNSTNTIVMA